MTKHKLNLKLKSDFKLIIVLKNDMREPGFEPGSQRWQRHILTTILLTLELNMHPFFKNLI